MKATNKLALLSLFCLPLVSSAAISTYYVDAENGDDSNDGKTMGAAFKTANKGFETINFVDNESGINNRGSSLVFAPGEYPLTSAPGVNGGGSNAKRSIVRSSTGNPADVVIYSDGTFECLRLGGFITVSGITFSNGVNSATCPSGGIRFSEHNDAAYKMIVSNCIVTCCNNAYGTGTNGAAVAIYGHNLMIDSVIRNNRASVMNGAGVLIMNNDTFKGVPRLERCRIEGNVATGRGGGVYVATSPRSTTYTSTGNSVEIIDCEIIGNRAADGAGVYFAIANLTANLTGCVISNNTATSNSGGIRLENSANMVMRDCLVEDNKAGSGAGADVIGATDATTALSCSNTVFRNNNATSTGGGVRVYNYARVMFEDTVFSENSAGNTGGGIYFNGQGKGWFNGCRFEGNKATSTTVSDDRGGGGIFLGAQSSTVHGYCSVSNCVFASNTSGSRAGGMGGTWNKCYFGGAIVNCVFTNNSCVAQGGGLVIRDNSTSTLNPDPPIVRNCLFAFNRTTANGGASDGTDANGGGVHFVTYSDITLENCTIVSNSVGLTKNNLSGGIHHRFTGGKLKNCIVAFNTVNGQPENANSWTSADNLYFNCCSDRAITRFTAANGCITGDPKFVDPANGDFSLQLGSPCIDAGLNADWMVGRKVKDLAGSVRISGEYVDIGCYERYFPLGLFLMLK